LTKHNNILILAQTLCLPVKTLFLQGEESVKERFTLDEDKVVPFLEMEYGLEQVGCRVFTSAMGFCCR
jgi:hypothetical protein